MPELVLKGKVRGANEVARGMALAPRVYTRFCYAWFLDERGRFLGGRGSRSKVFKGYRGILGRKPRRRRKGKWPPQLIGLFKGYVNQSRRIQGMSLRMGAGLNRRTQMHKAIEAQMEGALITSSREMPVPIYRNIQAAGGPARGYWKGKVFKRALMYKRLVRIRDGRRSLYFLKTGRRTSRTGRRFLRRALMFVGMHTIRLRPTLTGRYDFFARWSRAVPKVLLRGQGMMDRATKAVLEKGRRDWGR